jgi:hypothetical protein
VCDWVAVLVVLVVVVLVVGWGWCIIIACKLFACRHGGRSLLSVAPACWVMVVLLYFFGRRALHSVLCLHSWSAACSRRRQACMCASVLQRRHTVAPSAAGLLYLHSTVPQGSGCLRGSGLLVLPQQASILLDALLRGSLASRFSCTHQRCTEMLQCSVVWSCHGVGAPTLSRTFWCPVCVAAVPLPCHHPFVVYLCPIMPYEPSLAQSLGAPERAVRRGPDPVYE